MAPIEKSDLLQGTLDMLILKVVALGPIHGYGISQRIREISKEVLQVGAHGCLRAPEGVGRLVRGHALDQKHENAAFGRRDAVEARQQLAGQRRDVTDLP